MRRNGSRSGSIAASAGLTIAKAVIGLLTGSLAILSEAAHSLVDLAATVLTYFAVRVSGKPADAEHQYGHGKVESVSALAEAAFFSSSLPLLSSRPAQRLIGDHPYTVEATPAAFAIVVVSIIVDFFRARTLGRVAAATSSQALEADALHFQLRHVVVDCRVDRACRRRAGLFSCRRRGGIDCRRVHLHRRLAARPAHYRYTDRYGPGGRERARDGDRTPRAGRRHG